jgi:hypothetical protein
LFELYPFARHHLIQEIMSASPIPRISLPFASSFRHVNGIPGSNTLAYLTTRHQSILNSLRETLSTSSNRITIQPGIVSTQENRSNFISNQGLQFMGTIDYVTASNATRYIPNISESQSIPLSRGLHHLLRTESIGAGIPYCLPFILGLPEDTRKLSLLQVLIRQQIEFFSATEDDVTTHARGRNKPITLKQVGIRCRHCAILRLKLRKKGSVYFPFTLLGIYQASQNMVSTHFIQDNCNEFPSEIKSMIARKLGKKSTAGCGKEFWADAARSLGLLDTELGIRFIRDLVACSMREHTRSHT